MRKYYKFHWIQYESDKGPRQGEAGYFSTANPNIDEMKGVVKTSIVKDPSAVITIQIFDECSKEEYDRLCSNPIIVSYNV